MSDVRRAPVRDQPNPLTRAIAADLPGGLTKAQISIVNALALAGSEGVRLSLRGGPGSRRRAALASLAAAGYVAVEVGSKAAGLETVVQATAKFVVARAAAAAGAPLVIPSRFDNGKVVCRAKDGSELPIPARAKAKLEAELARFNLANAAHVWSVEAPNYGHLGHVFPFPAEGTLLDRSAVVYDRVFNRTMAEGGRFSARIQGIRRADRHRVRVNSLPLQGLDYGSMHTRLCYDRMGLTPPAECYAVPGWSRKDAKTLLNCALNVRSSRNCVQAYLNDQADRLVDPAKCHEVVVRSRAEVVAALDAAVAAHAPIAGDMFRKKGLGLMYLEAECARLVMLEMAAAGVPILALHDGHYVPAQHLAALEAAMVRAYRVVTKNPGANPVISRDPCGSIKNPLDIDLET